MLGNAKKLQAFIDDILEKLAQWFLKNKKTVSVATPDELIEFSKLNNLKLGLEEIKSVLKLVKGNRELCESILLSTKEIVEGRSLRQLVKRFAIKDVPNLNSLSNYQARIWYTWQKTKIETLISRIPKLEDKAKKAFELRNTFRTATRQYMKDRKLAAYLEDVEKNMTWEEYVLLKSKKFKGDGLWHEIIRTSQKGRDEVDNLFKLNN